MNSVRLQKHLKKEHRISYLSTYLREIVYGGNDGIITTFAVVAGFTGAQANVTSLPVVTVLLFGFANLFADGFSMALGNFLSSRSQQDVYRNEKKKERQEIQRNPKLEREETLDILQQKGFTLAQAEQLTEIYMTNEPYWLDFMMDQELEIPNPEHDNSFLMSLTTLFSFVAFGLIPLIPYIIFSNQVENFLFSCLASLAAMIALGLFRWRVSKQGLLRSVGENLILGGVAATIAYIVGSLFHF